MKPKPLAVLISSIISAPAMADAVDNSLVFNVGEVVVSATRMEQKSDEVSRPITVVDKETIDSIQPQSVAEVLANEPNILIDGGSRPGFQTINIRGLGDNRVLQTVDGVRQDFESGHRASYFLDPIILKSVEVVKGPASTLWGSGALGGVVAQSTIDAADILEGDADVGGLIKSSFNFNNDQLTTTAVVAGRTDSVDWLISGYGRDSNNIEMGNGEPLEDSASEDQGALAKIEWQINEDQSIAFNARHATVEGGVPSNGASQVNGSSVFLIDKDQVNNSLSADYRINTESPLLNAQIMAYWNSVDVDESRVSDGRIDNTEKDTYGLNLNNLSQFGDITLLYGVDGSHSNFSAERSGADRPTPPDADIDIWGAFAQGIIPLSDKWSVELGARYDYFSVTANNLDDSRSDNELSPSAALVWKTTDNLELTLRHDRAFRAPTAEELYSTGTHFCMGPGMCNTFIPNSDLKAEKAANTELLAKLKINNAWTLKTSIFENRVDDFIEQTVSMNPFPGNTYWENVDKAKLHGFEVSAVYSQNNVNLALGYGQTRGKDLATGDALNNIPADTWSADLSSSFLNDQLKAGVRVLHAEEQNLSTGDVYDDYTITDLYAAWQPAALKDLTINLTVNNATDEYYRRAWAEIYEAGREVSLAATYKF
ncbi:TonB-dependent hemoglobin/transferrin/lactoferrin family receptor [Neptuniibacter sp. 1_MG-2023]|uniref:TonB-dependent hemoglobin/transferrin/lactoferrin family receptor n=1 Tax=Neptuniibacter sp. 1_MG-2023 TaxID=3062662 RepID=UPI0026E262E9|nr:TonB-dependent hemoglobin/transferrin/lactoferrin family receptor [Neptuniibacter sp. 1_MG-2023]MDO6593556.1 TonB-dependent hemoglobin/transferrin/lactoferrin family receptor [Neptuniibacter sp. 1_MG-2023]